ncbi:efflux RND transporter periplasmic adaptor subunit, partial [Parabacteroides sp. OttesenSCG-928-N08]|nr:efflux RND transporter periplasmic adaptor subunit [Parabacteroides sp. OttesenSCG-928-N08]
MKHPISIYVIACLLFSLTACTSGSRPAEQPKETAEEIQALYTPKKEAVSRVEVDSIIGGFVSKGIIRAKTITPVYCSIREMIEEVPVKEWTYIRKGSPILRLRKKELENKVTEAKYTLQQTELEMKDVVISQGYSPDRQEEVPAEVLSLAKTKSGYDLAAIRYEMAREELNKTTLLAPVSGIIIEMEASPYGYTDTTLPVCQIMDVSELNVEFYILESEMRRVVVGQQVQVSAPAYRDESYSAEVIAISPIVNADGMITLYARIDSENRLLPDMHV